MTVVKDAKNKVKEFWESLDEITLFNQEKVLEAFQQAKASDYSFSNSTGYGYNDQGRETLEEIFSIVFKTEAALVRPQIVSGTHAINLCLSVLKPGDHLVSISGAPYDTLQQIIGTRGKEKNSLMNKGIVYEEVSLTEEGKLDYEAIRKVVTKETRMVMLQRSRGYSWRPSIPIADIEQAFKVVKAINPECICFVDNCYGEFAEIKEPTEVGANLMAGSLIKNPGGALAPSGGYIVGNHDLVMDCADSLTAPGLGNQLGATFGLMRTLMQGFFIAPHVVGQAMRGAILTAQVFQDLGYPVSPRPNEKRTDIIQAIQLGDAEKILAFCKGIQQASPIDSQFVPVPDLMPGYDDQVVMAGGTFIQGSSIELSADAPLRPPYIVYLQGGMSIEHVEIALNRVVKEFS